MSLESPTVSVIILAGSDNKYRSGTINSVRQQIFSDLEILIFSDGSSDNLLAWFNRQLDPRLKLFVQQNLNTAEVLNWGLKEAKGKYIAFLKAGDLWHPHKLQKQVLCLDRCPDIGLVHSSLTSIDDRYQSVKKIIKRELSGWVEPEILERNLVDYQSAVIRRSCFDKVGLFDSQLATTFDWDMWIRLSRHYQFLAIAEPLVYYRQHRDRIPQSWLTVETDLQATIEKAYRNAPKQLLTFKNRSYAYSSLSLARQVLQHQHPDTVIAYHYCRQALEHSFYVGCSGEFFQVALAVIVMGYLKSDRYNRLLILIETGKIWLQMIFKKFGLLAHLLLDWMLEEESKVSAKKSRVPRYQYIRGKKHRRI